VAGASIASWALAESLFAVFFPGDCRICGAPLLRISRLPVCQECLDAMRPIAGGLCAICGERLFSPYAVSSAAGEPRCGLCRRLAPSFARAVAYGSYDGGLRELIHLLKYGGVRPAANVLGRMLAEAVAVLEPDFSAGPVIVVPVPLFRVKQGQRGFNQAEMIARSALKLLPMGGRFRLGERVLERRRDTPTQTGLTTHQRRENMRGAFAVAQPEAVRGQEVLVVDDVVTTGATVSECARVLLRAGATKVWVASVARTLKASAQHAAIAGGGPMDEEFAAQEVPMAKAVGS
jgi:ComF family protein